MLWLNPSALFALAAVAAPILIHILIQRRAERFPFPTLRFLQPTRLAAIRRHLLEDLPLLAVRVGARRGGRRRAGRAAARHQRQASGVGSPRRSRDRRRPTTGRSWLSSAAAAGRAGASSAATTADVRGRLARRRHPPRDPLARHRAAGAPRDRDRVAVSDRIDHRRRHRRRFPPASASASSGPARCRRRGPWPAGRLLTSDGVRRARSDPDRRSDGLARRGRRRAGGVADRRRVVGGRAGRRSTRRSRPSCRSACGPRRRIAAREWSSFAAGGVQVPCRDRRPRRRRSDQPAVDGRRRRAHRARSRSARGGRPRRRRIGRRAICGGALAAARVRRRRPSACGRGRIGAGDCRGERGAGVRCRDAGAAAIDRQRDRRRSRSAARRSRADRRRRAAAMVASAGAGRPRRAIETVDQDDRRWLWVAVLCLLALESWVRRRAVSRGLAGTRDGAGPCRLTVPPDAAERVVAAAVSDAIRRARWLAVAEAFVFGSRGRRDLARGRRARCRRCRVMALAVDVAGVDRSRAGAGACPTRATCSSPPTNWRARRSTRSRRSVRGCSPTPPPARSGWTCVSRFRSRRSHAWRCWP